MGRQGKSQLPRAPVRPAMRVPGCARWLPYGVLIAVLLWAFRSVFAGYVLCFRDLYSIYAPPRLYLAEALRRGIMPLWDPYTGCGRDLLTELRAVLWYPLQLLMLPLFEARALVVMPLLHLAIAGCTMFALIRRLHLPTPAALLAALSAMLAHSMLAPIEFMWDAVLCWAPLNLLFLLLYVQQRRLCWLTGIAMVTVMQLTTHEVRAVVYGWMLLAVVWLSYVWRAVAAVPAKRRDILQLALSLPLAGVATTFLSLFWFLPMWSGNQLSQFRQDVDFAYFANGSIPLGGLPAYLIPYWNGQPLRGMWWNARMYNEYWPQALFCGTWVWLFAPATIPACLRRNTPHRALLIALWLFVFAALLFALGKYGPLLRILYDLLPAVRGARWPGVIMQSANIALVILGAYGVTTVALWLQKAALPPVRFWLAWAAALFVAVLWLRHCCLSPHFLASVFGLDPTISAQQLAPLMHLLHSQTTVPLAVIALSAACVGAAWFVRSTAPMAALWLLLALTAAELVYHARPLIVMLDARVYTTVPESILRVRHQPDYPLVRAINGNNIAILNLFLYGEHDWRKFLWYRSTAVAANHPMALRIPTAIPPDPPPIGQPWFDQFCRLFAPIEHDHAARAFLSAGEIWSVLRYDIPPYDERDPYRNLTVTRTTNWLPRITFPANVIPVASDAEASAVLTNAAFVFGRDAVVHTNTLPAPPALAGGAQATTLYFHEDYNYLRATVAVTRAGLAVINSSYHPDWRCYLDGQRVPALRVNYAFRGCSVPEGTHEIRFVYTPRLMYIGAAISGATLILLIAVCAAEELLRRRAPAPPRH